MANVDNSEETNYKKELQFERLVSIYFRITLFFSGLLMFIGLISYVLHPELSFDITTMTTTTIAQEITTFTPVGILFIGIIILVLIPLGRVVILLFYYFSHSDYRLMLCSAIVLIFMLTGMIFNLG